MKTKELTLQRLREVVRYDPESGVLERLQKGGAWRVCRASHPHGYVQLFVDGRTYLGHRIAWFMSHGGWPSGMIDHVNGDRSDNRISNLRDVTMRENLQNLRGPMAHNRTGFLGVGWHKRSRKFKARIVIDGKDVHIGLFDTPEEAHAAYLAAKRRHHAGCTI